MRNYIILNDRSSEEVPGLLIQELPPISKPLLRNQIEEIDGRDGDIVMPLGYAAYDKDVSIGLYGKFDVDDVIEYFNSEGKVVFSNEPDKYYKYQVLNQIDFERLVRFRTATVTFHVQPFKFANNEKAKTYTSFDNNSITVRNNGNYYSRPKITVFGTGTINLSLNGKQLFVINLGSQAAQITIDAEQLEAYDEDTNVLMNRSVDGDYDNLRLKVGTNTISWSGSVTKMIISNYSRWI
jgi:predicted phage tail component-like protein